jgi:hypothetical protein
MGAGIELDDMSLFSAHNRSTKRERKTRKINPFARGTPPPTLPLLLYKYNSRKKKPDPRVLISNISCAPLWFIPWNYGAELPGTSFHGNIRGCLREIAMLLPLLQIIKKIVTPDELPKYIFTVFNLMPYFNNNNIFSSNIFLNKIMVNTIQC